jgi:hypothetical protein
MKDVPYCFACQFFVPEGMLHNELEDADNDRYMTTDGECRRECPHHGAALTDDNGHLINYGYGRWPIVQGCEWCGQFRSKHDRAPSDHPTLKLTS